MAQWLLERAALGVRVQEDERERARVHAQPTLAYGTSLQILLE